jgi:hypothetical protein
MKNIRLLFLFLFCLFGQLISSRPNIYFRSLGVEEGLSQNMVYAICQDRQGFMWFGTQDGLNRYDGHSFKIYKKDVIYPDGLKSDAIFSLKKIETGIYGLVRITGFIYIIQSMTISLVYRFTIIGGD